MTQHQKIEKKSLNPIQLVNACFVIFFPPFSWSFPLGPFGSIKQPTTNSWKIRIFGCKIMEFVWSEFSDFLRKKHQKNCHIFVHGSSRLKKKHKDVKSQINKLESHFRGRLSNKKINMEIYFKMDYP